jgi:ornithine cyclodeaminase
MTRVLAAADVERLLTPDVAIASAERAFRSLALGEAQLAEKILFEGDGTFATSLVYAARAALGAPVTTKLVSLSPDNPSRGLPLISATVLLTDPVTGLVQAMLDGTSLTTLRTAAASALSVRLLARPESAVLAVIGSGVQARAHVRAIREVLDLTDTRIWSPDAGRRAAAAAELGGEVRAVDSVGEAIAAADVISCCTHSAEPVVFGADVPVGCHVISVGSYLPDRAEVDDELIRRASVVSVDDRIAAFHHAGSIIGAVARGAVAEEDVVSIGEVLVGAVGGRTAPDEITFFNSIGLGIQDATAAEAVLIEAEKTGAGLVLPSGA